MGKLKHMKIKEMVNKKGRKMSISFIFNSIKLMCKTIHKSYNLPGDEMGFPFGITRWEPSSAVTMASLYGSMCLNAQNQ